MAGRLVTLLCGKHLDISVDFHPRPARRTTERPSDKGPAKGPAIQGTREGTLDMSLNTPAADCPQASFVPWALRELAKPLPDFPRRRRIAVNRKNMICRDLIQTKKDAARVHQAKNPTRPRSRAKTRSNARAVIKGSDDGSGKKTTRIAAAGKRKTKAWAYLAGLTNEQKAKARDLDKVETYGGKEYRATEYEANRERWLNGEQLSWSDYFNLRDYAAATENVAQDSR